MHSPKITWFFLPALVIFLACNGQKKMAMNENDGQTTESPLTLVLQGNFAGTDTATTHIIENQKDLTQFFSGVNKTRKPGIPVPKVDFSKDMVVVYCSGIEGNGTTPILNLATESDSEMILGMVDKSLNDEEPKTISPFSVYTMPLTTKKISFKAVE